MLAGLLVATVSIYNLLWIDALSFGLSALSLAWIRTGFNVAEAKERSSSMWTDVKEGLRYVLGHPVLRNISLMMCLVNFFGTTAYSQLVFFGQQRLHTSESQVGYLFAAGSLGVVVLGLLAGFFRKHWSFSRVALGALFVAGLLQIFFALNGNFWVALPLWALTNGLGILFNINTGSLRQVIVPNHMLGRVLSIAGVLAWSAIPLGSYLGGLAIEYTGNVALVYLITGVMVTLIPLVFAFTPLGRAEEYMPKVEVQNQ